MAKNWGLFKKITQKVKENGKVYIRKVVEENERKITEKKNNKI